MKTSNPIITFVDGYKFRLIRMPFWDNIYNAHLQKRGTYIPKNQEDWEEFIDKIEGRKPIEPPMSEHFMDRADGDLVKIDGSQQMRLT